MLFFLSDFFLTSPSFLSTPSFYPRAWCHYFCDLQSPLLHHLHIPPPSHHLQGQTDGAQTTKQRPQQQQQTVIYKDQGPTNNCSGMCLPMYHNTEAGFLPSLPFLLFISFVSVCFFVYFQAIVHFLTPNRIDHSSTLLIHSWHISFFYSLFPIYII